MKFETFEMERMQSTWENRVAWNVSESGVHPLRVEEVADTDADRAALLGLHLGYSQTNGTPELRAAIAAMYPGATPEHIEVTNGGSEANCIAMMHLIEPGDHFEMDGYLRIGFGSDPTHLEGSLERIAEVLDSIQETTADAR